MTFGSQLTLHKVEVFCAVAELGSVSRAAQRLGIAQPAVTAHLHALQDKLGAALIARNGRGIGLTAEGVRVYEWAREIIARTRELERELGEEPGSMRGHVAIGASLTVGGYVLPRHLVAYRRNNPGVNLSVRVTQPRDCVTNVTEGTSDFAISLLDPGQSTDGLHTELLWNERLVLVSAPGGRTTVMPSEIPDLPFVAAESSTARRDIEEATLRPHGIVRRRVELEIGQPEGMKEAVMNGAGVTFLFAASVGRELRHGELCVIDTPGLNLTAPVYFIARRGKHLSAVQASAAEYLKTALRA